MKIKKKQAMVISVVVGSILFATTAFAEISSKNGYEQLKDGLKYTAESCVSKLSNYTVDMSMVMKDNGKIISQSNELLKYDVTKGAKENISTGVNEGKARDSYYYTDKNSSITFNKEQGVYYVNEFEKQNDGVNITNPFKERRASDMEKIADAIIGNLKDSVVVTENADGTKQLSGTLSEAQIPAIANALVSYGFKSEFGNSYKYDRVVAATGSTMPKIADDIYVKEIKGNMTLNKEGLIESAMGTGLLSGKDEQGIEHKLTFELLVKISDVNKTVVNKPDFTGKKVETRVQRDYSKLSQPERYLGTYNNDIIIEKDGKFEKIGERIVDITSLDEKNIAGRYHEEYTKGNEEYALKARDFKFASIFLNDSLQSDFDSTDSLGNKVKGSLWIDVTSPRIGFNINGEQHEITLNNGQYNRVFN